MAIITDNQFVTFRKALIAEVQRSLKIVCIALEPVEQNAPRPVLPYMTCKFTTPNTRQGFPAVTYTGNGDEFNYGLQATMVVSFQCYAETQEEAYYHMTLWRQLLQVNSVRARLRADGLAVWDPGSIADLSALLNTGYEGRSQMDVTFGFALNITDDLGEIEQAAITGTVDTNGAESTVVFNAPESP